MNSKFIIYQLLIRAFGNISECISDGSYNINGSGKFNNITSEVLIQLQKLKITHIWLTGVIEHATQTDYSKFGIKSDNHAIVKGKAGSPYAIKDYYDVDPDLAVNVTHRMNEFISLIELIHSFGIKVIIDFVPNHLSRGYNSDSAPEGTIDFGSNDDTSINFSPNNNFYYLTGQKLLLQFNGEEYLENPAKATGNNYFSTTPSENDWYETIKLNYGIDYFNSGTCYFTPIPKTWLMMLDILKFWCNKGVDGFRCDMAELVPVEFWKWSISNIKQQYPNTIFIGETYNIENYKIYLESGKFDYLYDKVNFYDTLKLISKEECSANAITSAWQKIDKIQNKMLNFLENHDEQRVASDFNLADGFRALPELIVSLMINKSPFMLYCGEEFGERGMQSEGYSKLDGRTSIYDYCNIPSIKRFLTGRLSEKENTLFSMYKRLFSISMEERAIREGDSYDLEYANKNNPNFSSENCYAFARRTRASINCPDAHNELIIIVVDFRCKNGSGKLVLPENFFKYWNIHSGKEYIVKNLLYNFYSNENREYKTILAYDKLFSFNLNQYGISISKIQLD